MKKRKLNSKGFALVETLIVSVFVMTIFSIIYNNFYPLMGEYEKREVYDEVDAKYATYWIKRLIQDAEVHFTDDNIADLDKADNKRGYFKFNCDYFSSDSKKKMCNRIINASQVKMAPDNTPNIYITTYNLEDFKNKIEIGAKNLPDEKKENFSGGMHRYVGNLPEFRVDSLNNAQYRVIVEYYRTRNDNDYLAYSTFEIKKDNSVVPAPVPPTPPTPPTPPPAPILKDYAQGASCLQGKKAICFFTSSGLRTNEISSTLNLPYRFSQDYDITPDLNQQTENWYCARERSIAQYGWWNEIPGSQIYSGIRCWEGSQCYSVLEPNLGGNESVGYQFGDKYGILKKCN